MGSQNISDEAMDTAMKKIVEDTVGSIPEPPKKKHTVLHLYLQVLPEIAISVVVWIDNHLLQDNLWIYHHNTKRMLASLDSR